VKDALRSGTASRSVPETKALPLQIQSDDDLFAHALALSAAERAAYLEIACAGDAPRRANLASMLAAAAAATAGNFMAGPLLPPPRTTRTGGEPERIGRYRVLEKIGEGGCGTVFRAEQREPVRREVALKIIKPGMDTAAVVARFAAERQALAVMDHPGIAKVFDAGATEAGRPFFAMELVRGVRITDYCEREKLSVAERLRLFIAVCHAVEHAHQKGIVHRDLKPSNLLVTLQDGAAVPKVIDFGIAKALQGRLTDATLATTVEQLLGTPSYMSPERAGSGALDLDPRSDLYSLGVVLYELLTRRLPFERTGPNDSVDDLRRAIREREPSRPSTHARELRGDLDWIMLKCLEPDRARRYASAAALALDLERHLTHQPVLAAAPGAGYVVGKFLRRHRVAIVTGGVIAFLLCGGLALSTWLFLREQAMLERARYSEQKTVEAYRAALKERARADAAKAAEAPRK
jgi:eukaryotic-like serine/threonine-protein kinase